MNLILEKDPTLPFAEARCERRSQGPAWTAQHASDHRQRIVLRQAHHSIPLPSRGVRQRVEAFFATSTFDQKFCNAAREQGFTPEVRILQI